MGAEGAGRVYGVRPARCRPVLGGGTSDHALEAHFRIQKTFCSSVRAVAPDEGVLAVPFLQCCLSGRVINEGHPVGRESSSQRGGP